MRIVQVANFYAPTSGGLRVVVEETGREYLAAGHERVLIVPGRDAAVDETPSGRRIVVPSLRLPWLGNYRILLNRRRVRQLLDDRPPDVLEVSDKFSLSWLSRWARQRGIPVVLFSHERIDAILKPRFPAWFPLRAVADRANRRLSHLADLIVVTSAFSGAEFDRIGTPHLCRVRLGVDLETFRPPAVAPPGRAAGPVRLITVSRLSKEKAPERAIETLRALLAAGVPATLVMAGEGPDRAALEERAAGLPVTFLGHVFGRRAVAELIGAADVALCPSEVETFGLAVLEAMACGTPVVVPDGGAARELLAGPGSGEVGDGTAEGLADAVRRLLAVPESQRRAAARAAAERYPWTATADGLLTAYAARRAASASSPASPLPAR